MLIGSSKDFFIALRAINGFVSCFQDLVEKVMMLRKSIERLRNTEVAVQSPVLAEKLTCYAGILAAEGSLAAAMAYLPEDSDQVRPPIKTSVPCFCWIVYHVVFMFGCLRPQPGIMMLKDRLFHAQGEATAHQQAPNSFNRDGVPTAEPTPAAQTPQPSGQNRVEISSINKYRFKIDKHL